MILRIISTIILGLIIILLGISLGVNAVTNSDDKETKIGTAFIVTAFILSLSYVLICIWMI